MIMHKKSQEGDDSFILMECDAEVTKEIMSLFKKYKIRKKVSTGMVYEFEFVLENKVVMRFKSFL